MKLNESEQRFISNLGSLMRQWGLPPATGQLYGYLLLNDSPVDLDTMVADLRASKSGLSVAARQLESWFLVRCVSQPGSRRILYEVDGDVDRLLRVNTVQLRRFSDTMRHGAKVSSGLPSERLATIAEVFEVYVTASAEALAARRAQLGEAG